MSRSNQILKSEQFLKVLDTLDPNETENKTYAKLNAEWKQYKFSADSNSHKYQIIAVFFNHPNMNIAALEWLLDLTCHPGFNISLFEVMLVAVSYVDLEEDPQIEFVKKRRNLLKHLMQNYSFIKDILKRAMPPAPDRLRDYPSEGTKNDMVTNYLKNNQLLKQAVLAQNYYFIDRYCQKIDTYFYTINLFHNEVNILEADPEKLHYRCKVVFYTALSFALENNHVGIAKKLIEDPRFSQKLSDDNWSKSWFGDFLYFAMDSLKILSEDKTQAQNIVFIITTLAQLTSFHSQHLRPLLHYMIEGVMEIKDVHSILKSIRNKFYNYNNNEDYAELTRALAAGKIEMSKAISILNLFMEFPYLDLNKLYQETILNILQLDDKNFKFVELFMSKQKMNTNFFQHALLIAQPKTLDFLLKKSDHSIDLNKKPNWPWDWALPLTRAIKNKRFEMVKVLLTHGASYSQEDLKLAEKIQKQIITDNKDFVSINSIVLLLNAAMAIKENRKQDAVISCRNLNSIDKEFLFKLFAQDKSKEVFLKDLNLISVNEATEFKESKETKAEIELKEIKSASQSLLVENRVTSTATVSANLTTTASLLSTRTSLTPNVQVESKPLHFSNESKPQSLNSRQEPEAKQLFQDSKENKETNKEASYLKILELVSSLPLNSEVKERFTKICMQELDQDSSARVSIESRLRLGT